jgi:O-antigen/teichoic acid export membrane protein
LIVAIVAFLTALIAALLYLNPDVSEDSAVSCSVAAICLALVAPFEALEPQARKRVVAGCVAFVVAIVIAFALAVQSTDDRAPLGALGSLASVGIVLVAWSFTIRNRRHRPQWRDYYDR